MKSASCCEPRWARLAPTLIDTVYMRGDGNPLFTCQVATNLVEATG